SGTINAAALSDGHGLSWFGLQGTGLGGTLVVPGVTATVANLAVSVNQAKGTGATAMDWTQPALSAANLTLTTQILSAAGDLQSLDVFGLLSGSMHFSVTKAPVTLTSPAVTAQPLLTFSFSQLQLAVGTSTFGLQITSGSINAAALADGSGLSWFGLQGTGLGGTLTVPGVTATLANLAVSVNQAKGTGAMAMDWTQSALSAAGLTLTSQMLSAAGDLQSLDVFGLLSGSLHFSVSKTPVTLTSPAVTAQPLLTFSFSQLQLAVGTSTFGLQITSGTINAAALADGSGLSWFGLQGTGLGGALAVPGVTATLANLAVSVNQAKGTGATAMDWTQSALSAAGLTLTSQVLSAAGDLQSLDVFGLLSGSMHF